MYRKETLENDAIYKNKLHSVETSLNNSKGRKLLKYTEGGNTAMVAAQNRVRLEERIRKEKQMARDAETPQAKATRLKAKRDARTKEANDRVEYRRKELERLGVEGDAKRKKYLVEEAAARKIRTADDYEI